MLISSDGTIIRIRAQDISLLGRATQGVTLMRMDSDIHLVSVARIEKVNGDEECEETENATERCNRRYKRGYNRKCNRRCRRYGKNTRSIRRKDVEEIEKSETEEN